MTTVRDDLVHELGQAWTAEQALEKVLEALKSPVIRQQVVLEIDPLEMKMTVQMVDTALDAIIAVLSNQDD